MTEGGSYSLIRKNTCTHKHTKSKPPKTSTEFRSLSQSINGIPCPVQTTLFVHVQQCNDPHFAVQYSTNAHSLIDTMHLDSDPLHNLDHRPICFPSHNRYFDPCPVIYENDTEIEFVLLKPVKRRFRSSEIYMYQCTFPGNFSGRPTPVEIPKNTCFCSSE